MLGTPGSASDLRKSDCTASPGGFGRASKEQKKTQGLFTTLELQY